MDTLAHCFFQAFPQERGSKICPKRFYAERKLKLMKFEGNLGHTLQ